MHDTLYSFCINFDTTQLFDVTFLLRNIIVTLTSIQKQPRKLKCTLKVRQKI